MFLKFFLCSHDTCLSVVESRAQTPPSERNRVQGCQVFFYCLVECICGYTCYLLIFLQCPLLLLLIFLQCPLLLLLIFLQCPLLLLTLGAHAQESYCVYVSVCVVTPLHKQYMLYIITHVGRGPYSYTHAA